ncbi:MAG: hypothetical protein F9K23_09885 [Bacteroidetes bacterium]|nr:MAG: hypothetical protein F9K23_09885 [Bacteroidota bacterium]
MDEEKYTEGFNNGYFLSEIEPGMLEKLLSGTQGENEYLQGLKDGHLEYKKEAQMNKIREHYESKNTKSRDGKDAGR